MSLANCPLPLAVVFTPQILRWCVWVGMVLLTGALLLLVRTRWGQSHPLRKCIVLSLVAHLLLGIYTTTVNIVTATGGGQEGQALSVSFVDDGPENPNAGPRDGKPWETFAPGAPSEPETASLAADPQPGDDEPPLPEPALQPAKPRFELPLAELAPARIEARAPMADRPPRPAAKQPEPIESPTAEREEPKPTDIGPPDSDSSEADVPPAPAPRHSTPAQPPLVRVDVKRRPADAGATDNAGATDLGGHSPLGPHPPAHSPLGPAPITGAAGKSAGADGGGGGEPGSNHQVPSIYKLRVSGDRSGVAAGHGGNKDTEAAVTAALTWLAANQSQNGRWDPQRFGAGREVMIDGQDRRGAGSQADTGITGLALLAFLAAGNTHAQGEHQVAARRGLEYLLANQGADGNLCGQATLYERMYCHAMAAFAVSEAYAISGDDRLQSAVRRAIGYTVAGQHPATGGWRYQPGEPGDTSQLGWQVMALKSAELAGIKMPEQTRSGIDRFLRSVTFGRQSGLACYRPGHPISRTMTAEALVCRQFLGMDRNNPACNEAGDYLLGELPGAGQTNLYYWYYGTLAMYQLQGTYWERWNQALQLKLLGTQRVDGDLAGSWDPDNTWGAYGGRAYSTALSALCLEVYYRFLPLYVEAAGRERTTK